VIQAKYEKVGAVPALAYMSPPPELQQLALNFLATLKNNRHTSARAHLPCLHEAPEHT